MSFFECVPSPKIADETVFRRRKGDFDDLPIPAPLSESEFFKRPSNQLPKSSNKKFWFGRKAIVVGAILGLATGIGGAWSSPHIFTDNLKAANLRGVVESIFAGFPKTEQSTQSLPAVADATGPKLGEIADQLATIANELSSLQQNIKELAGGQEQIRKAQEQLAQTQARLAVSQTQVNLKQQLSSNTSESRKLNRRDPWKYIIYGDRQFPRGY
jgi:hypothetical protein